MQFDIAKQLHDEDTVTVKETNEVVTVLNTEVLNKKVVIYAVNSSNGYLALTHKEIK